MVRACTVTTAVGIDRDFHIFRGGRTRPVGSEVEEGKEIHCSRACCRGGLAECRFESSELRKDEVGWDSSGYCRSCLYALRILRLGSDDKRNGERWSAPLPTNACLQGPFRLTVRDRSEIRLVV